MVTWRNASPLGDSVIQGMLVDKRSPVTYCRTLVLFSMLAQWSMTLDYTTEAKPEAGSGQKGRKKEAHMPTKHPDLHGNVPDEGAVALLLIDVVQLARFGEAERFAGEPLEAGV
jgi:hypothetical protein